MLRLKGSAAKRSKLNRGHAEEEATVRGGASLRYDSFDAVKIVLKGCKFRNSTASTP